MLDYEFSVLTSIYLFGKRLQSLAKRHNNDLMSQSIILQLADRGAVSVSDIADLLSIKVSASTSKMNELERKGLVQRERTADKRSHAVVITPRGKSELSVLTRRMSAHCPGHTLGITEGEARMLELVLKKITLEVSV